MDVFLWQADFLTGMYFDCQRHQVLSSPYDFQLLESTTEPILCNAVYCIHVAIWSESPLLLYCNHLGRPHPSRQFPRLRNLWTDPVC